MKFIINKEIFLEGLNIISHGLSTKNLIPVLSGIKLELTNDKLLLTTTDNDISIKVDIAKINIHKIEKTGSIILIGKYLIEIIRKLPNELINFEVLTDAKIVINTSTSEFNLNGIEASEFPNLVMEESKSPLIIPKKIFKNIINQTIFATSTEETRPILTGINMKNNDNRIECTATDSYRLAKTIFSTKIENDVNVVIPSKNLLELLKILTDDGNIELNIFSNKILFKFDNVLFQTRLLSGTYPDTTNLIPKEFDLVINLNLKDFYNILDRASLLTSEKDKNIVHLTINEKDIILTSTIPEIGRVEEQLNIINKGNKKLSISFSAKYMMDALKKLSSENIEIMFNGEMKPIIVKEENNDDLIQLILPIKTY